MCLPKMQVFMRHVRRCALLDLSDQLRPASPWKGDAMAGHAFISYVHENSRAVNRLQRIIESAGIRVWRDTADLWPGEDWSSKIREAITDNALVFIACFSSQGIAREGYAKPWLLLAGGSLSGIAQKASDTPHQVIGNGFSER
jgi:TIR domain